MLWLLFLLCYALASAYDFGPSVCIACGCAAKNSGIVHVTDSDFYAFVEYCTDCPPGYNGCKDSSLAFNKAAPPNIKSAYSMKLIAPPPPDKPVNKQEITYEVVSSKKTDDIQCRLNGGLAKIAYSFRVFGKKPANDFVLSPSFNKGLMFKEGYGESWTPIEPSPGYFDIFQESWRLKRKTKYFLFSLWTMPRNVKLGTAAALEHHYLNALLNKLPIRLHCRRARGCRLAGELPQLEAYCEPEPPAAPDAIKTKIALIVNRIIKSAKDDDEARNKLDLFFKSLNQNVVEQAQILNGGITSSRKVNRDCIVKVLLELYNPLRDTCVGMIDNYVPDIGIPHSQINNLIQDEQKPIHSVYIPEGKDLEQHIDNFFNF